MPERAAPASRMDRLDRVPGPVTELRFIILLVLVPSLDSGGSWVVANPAF